MTVGRVVVMGVAGVGKSTLGTALAARLGVPFLEGDDLHPPSNVAKMAAGVPLDDADRWPWLAAVRSAMRDEGELVVACSALKRSYRDALRAAGGVRFLCLVAPPELLAGRLEGRGEHFMGADMLESQLATLEPPGPEEVDAVTLEAEGGMDSLVSAAADALATLPQGTAVAPILADGGPGRSISPDELAELVRRLAADEILAGPARRILIVPPDYTRLHSRAGEITALLCHELTTAGCEVWVLPALGTHAPMNEPELRLLFGDRLPLDRVLTHRWREGLVSLGEISAGEVAALSRGRFSEPIPVEVDEQLLAGWDLVVSVGQVVPHEVIGMANFTKNLVIGLGGAATIDCSHFLGAVYGMESIMGRANGPVRDAVDAAFDRHLRHRVEVLWVMTVTEDTPDGVVLRGLFGGRGGSGESGGAAYRAAAELTRRCDVVEVEPPLERISCWLDPAEFRTTWLANKAVYRTRMALADGGELVVLAPGVRAFGEDPAVDALVRRHGYRGTAATLAALRGDPALAASLGAAAHLIHGSSEGRFRIVYCTDPEHGGLGRAEVEGVGYTWRALPDELDRLGVDGATVTGRRRDREGRSFLHIANPALGLWAAAGRIELPAR